MNSVDMLQIEIFKKGRVADLFYDGEFPYLLWQDAGSDALQRVDINLLSSWRNIDSTLKSTPLNNLLVSYLNGYYRTALFSGNNVMTMANRDLRNCLDSIENTLSAKKEMANQIGGFTR